MYIFFLDLCNKTFFCLNELLLCCVRSSHNWLEVKNRVQGCHWAGVNSSPITGPNVGEILFFTLTVETGRTVPVQHLLR